MFCAIRLEAASIIFWEIYLMFRNPSDLMLYQSLVVNGTLCKDGILTLCFVMRFQGKNDTDVN